MRSTLRPLAALAMLAVIVAGCSNGSADTGNSTATSGGNSSAATHEQVRPRKRLGGRLKPAGQGKQEVDAEEQGGEQERDPEEAPAGSWGCGASSRALLPAHS